MSQKLLPYILSVALVVSYFLFRQEYGFTGSSSVATRFLYPFCHANLWHLAANIVCLFMICMHKPKTTTVIAAYVMSVCAAFLPSCMLWGDSPTTGFSGVLFAIVGISWGHTRMFREMLWRNKLFLIVPFFIPNINAMLHLYCLVLGFSFGYIRPYLNRLCVRR